MVKLSGLVGYRDRIYDHYVSAFKGHSHPEQRAAEIGRHARFLDHLLAPLVDELRPTKILDVGCGQGRFLFWARARGFQNVCGFDRSEEQVGVARSLGLTCEVATTDDYLARCDRDFDLVVAMDILEHFARDEALALLAQCRACLRPGGMMLLTTPNGSGWRAGPVIYGDLTHETVFSPQTIELAFHLSGFTEIRVFEIVPPPTSLRSRVRAGLWKIVRLVPAALDVIERGAPSTRVYSRVMGVVARAPLVVSGEASHG